MAASIRELANQASFIFEGTLRRTGAATRTAVPPSPEVAPEMAVVHVLRILKGPPALAKFSGRDIAMQMRGPPHPEHEREFIFFTTGLSYGDSLAVREVGHIAERGPEVERELHEAEREKRDEALSRRLGAADIVVTGEAIRVGEFRWPEGTRRHVSEHDPDWWECEIRVRDIEKGRIEPARKGHAGATEVVTLFAHSIDVLWHQSPKFQKGDEGIWLLHRTDFRGNPAPGLVTDHPLDFHPLSEHERIRALLERLRH